MLIRTPPFQPPFITDYAIDTPLLRPLIASRSAFITLYFLMPLITLFPDFHMPFSRHFAAIAPLSPPFLSVSLPAYFRFRGAFDAAFFITVAISFDDDYFRG
jgi:hypothetical protein